MNDAVSLLSIADGAMHELGSILTRIKELATQSANGSYSSVQRRALDEEAQKQRDEFNRILATTQFNGVKLLNGSQSTVAIQAGSDGTNPTLELTAPNVAGLVSSSAYSMNFNGTSQYIEKSSASLGTIYTASFWFKPTADITTASSSPTPLTLRDGGAGDYFYVALGAATGSVANETITILHDSTGRTSVQGATLTAGTWHHLALSWNSSQSRYDIYLDGAVQTVTSGSSHSALLTDPERINVGSNDTTNGGAANFFGGNVDDLRLYNRSLSAEEITTLNQGGNPSSTGLRAYYDFEEGGGSTVFDRSNNGNNASLTNAPTWSTSASAQFNTIVALETFSLATVADARTALDTIETAFSRLSSETGELGAQLSRLQIIANTLFTARENYQAAAGRIKDADVAQESATLVRQQILQQTASSVLAQANQQPQLAIQLLQRI